MAKDIDLIKERIDLVDLLRSYITLHPAGKNFKALCPFHQEKTPSFIASPERKRWHCFGCFPPGQKIKTPFGYHDIETIDENHYVYSGRGVVRKVLATHRRNYRGELIDVMVRKLGGVVSLTADHKLNVLRPKTRYVKAIKQFYRQCRNFIKKNNADTEDAIRHYADLKEISAGEISSKDLVLCPINTRTDDIETINLRDYLKKEHRFGPKPKDLRYEQKISDPLLKLLGYWIAEGSNHRAYIRFSLGGHEEKFGQEIVSLIKKCFGLTAPVYRRKGNKSGIEITACHSFLANIFENLCGKGAANKHVPFVFQTLPPPKQKVLLDAIFKGDGHEFTARRSDKKHRKLTTVSQILAEQVVDILLRNDIFPSLHVTEKKVDKMGVNHKKVYIITWSETATSRQHFTCTLSNVKYWLLPVREVKRREYVGPVYNLTVEKDHSYIATNFAVANCGEDGDIVTFVMKYENLEFPEALRVLAEKAGIELQSVNPALQKEYGLLYGLHDDATEFYKEALLKNENARAYLKGRGLTEETITDFNLGFAPGGDSLTLHLIKKGYDVLDIARAGLAYKTARGLYRDRFNQRIMFPIANHLGKVVAFTGRIMPEAEASADPNSIDAAKYVNSPETPIFNKSKILYGLNASKGAIAKSRTATLVEGQMDFLMMWQTGVKNAVAVSGTGLTPYHLERLRRLADTVIVNFDNDEAGLKALERALDVFGGFDFHLKVLDLGDYKDAAEACEVKPEYVAQAIEWAKPAFNHLFGFYFGKGAPHSIPERKRVLRHLLQKIKGLKSAVEQNIWIKELATASGVGENALLSEMASIGDVRRDSVEAPQGGGGGERSRADLISGRLISLAFARDEFLEELKSKKHIFPAIYQSVIDDPKNEKAAMFDLRSAVDFADLPPEDVRKEFALLVKHLEMEHLKETRAALQEKIRVGQASLGKKELEDYMTEFYALSKKIDEFRSAV